MLTPWLHRGREARTKLSRRPWRVDTFDVLAAKWFSLDSADSLAPDGVPRSPFRRVIMFVDNAGMQPLLWVALLQLHALEGPAYCTAVMS